MPLNTASPTQQLDNQTVERILYTVKTEAAAGRTAESEQLLVQLARQAPHHAAVLNELGVRMLARGAAEQAHALFTRATASMYNGKPPLRSNTARHSIRYSALCSPTAPSGF